LSDAAAAIAHVQGVDYVAALTLLLESVPQGERVEVAPQRIVVAGEIRIKVL
jgi:hypothetical protein